mgnify:CR=1 FL=1
MLLMLWFAKIVIGAGIRLDWGGLVTSQLDNLRTTIRATHIVLLWLIRWSVWQLGLTWGLCVVIIHRTIVSLLLLSMLRSSWLGPLVRNFGVARVTTTLLTVCRRSSLYTLLDKDTISWILCWPRCRWPLCILRYLASPWKPTRCVLLLTINCFLNSISRYWHTLLLHV